MARTVAGITIILTSCALWTGTMTLAFGASLAQLCQGPAPSPANALDAEIMAYIDSTRADAGLPPLQHDDFSEVKMQQHACKAAPDQSRWVDKNEYLERIPIYQPLRRAIESEQYCHVGMWHFARDGQVIGGVGMRQCVGMAL